MVQRHLAWMGMAGNADRTIYLRDRLLTQLAEYLAPTGLLEASREDLLGWRQQLRVGPRTVSQYASHISGFYRWCVDEDLLDRTPFRRIPVPRVGRTLPRPPDDKDVMEAVAAAPERLRPWLILAYWEGLRCIEISLLRRECLLEKMRPPVLMITPDATKGNSGRMLPLHPTVWEDLEQHGLPRRGYLFRRRDHAAGPNTSGLISHRANEYLAGWGMTMHQLRHGFATRLLEETQNLRLVQELLGHASPTSTAVYTLVDLHSAATAMASFPDVPPRRVPGSPL